MKVLKDHHGFEWPSLAINPYMYDKTLDGLH